MISQVASSPQRARSAGQPTPQRPPSGVQSSGRLCRGRSASIAMDGNWVESFLGGNEARGRIELENERESFLERMELCAATERHAIGKAYVYCSSKSDGGLTLVGGAPANECQRYIRASCLFLAEEEDIMRHHLEVLYDQGAKRFRMLCNSAVCDVDLSRAGSFRLKASFNRGSPGL
ncbi:Hypothetical protein, putative [Bodo saltans]|uniref:Uncharacterized protein n=1 Tax=Bodo saltans TaxID=75058 RepID=A0A0S4J114_BODSA|nr:Hypothetical protein, putative [Bodo saltans]|eukprot:CUG01444.1 Hypothetical protein, putative [Bodo saltans]